MTKNIFTLFLLSACLNAFGQLITLSPDSLYHKNNGEKIFLKSQVDNSPKYQPGESELFSFIAKNLNYPSDAKENNIQGKVYASFVIEKSGNISDIIIIKGLTESCDKEVKRIISTLPNKWTPALKDGQPVRFQYILPISFKLSGVNQTKPVYKSTSRPYQRPEDRLYEHLRDNKYGFTNYEGKVIINPVYPRIRNFLNGYAAVMNDNFMWGLIDTKGNLVLPHRYSFLLSPTEGLVCFALEDLIGYMDITGKVIIKPRFRTGFEFEDGLAIVEDTNGKWGYIDKKGNVAIKFIYDDILPYMDGGAIGTIAGKQYELDTKGRVVGPYKPDR